MFRDLIRAAAAAVAIAVVVPVASAQPVLVTFNGANGANDLNNFIVNHDGNPIPTSGAGSNFNFGATAGVQDNGGSAGGGLITTSTGGGSAMDASASYVGPGGAANPTKWNLRTGATVSAFFNAAAVGTTTQIVQIGFQNQPNNSFNGDAGTATDTNAFVTVRTYGNGEIQLQTKSTLASGSAATVNSDFLAAGTSLINGEWYKLTFTVTETSATNFNTTAILDDYGTAGTSFVGNVFAGSKTASSTGFEVSNGSLLGADGLGIAAIRQPAQTPFLDNFAVSPVPEPTSLALLGCAAAGWLIRRRSQKAAQL